MALGMRYAPKRGEETREEIAKSFQELRNKAKHQLDETCAKKKLYNEDRQKNQ